MKYIFILLLLNSYVFAGNEIVIKASSEKISFELYGSDSAHFKVDNVNFKLKIHNYSDKKFFFIDPEAINPKPIYNPESLSGRVFINYGGIYNSGMRYWRLKVLEPGDSLEIPIQIDIKVLNPTKQYHSYFVEVDAGYFQYDKYYEYLTIKDEGNFVNFASAGDEIKFSVQHRMVVLCCMPITLNLMEQSKIK